MDLEAWSAKRVVFWVALCPVIVLSTAIVLIGAPLLAPPGFDQGQIAREFLARVAPECAPEALEQLGYVLAVLAPVGLMLVSLSLIGRTRLREQAPKWPRWVRVTVLGTQGLVIAAGTVGWLYESIWGRHYFREWASLGVLAAALAAWAAYRRYLGARAKVRVLAVGKALLARPWAAWAVAAAWTSGLLLTCIFTNVGIGAGQPMLGYHLDFTMGEFAAASNGSTPLVDFFPQYQNLTPLLLAPVFTLIGFDVTRFTLVMCALSLLGLMLVYATLVKVAGKSWTALVLFVPFATASFLHASRLPGGFYTNTFNYYAVGPLRYLGLFALALATAWYLSAPRRWRLLLAAALGGAVALNNLDFGVPAALGLLFAALLFPPPGGRAWHASSILTVAAAWLVGASAGVGAGMLLVRVARGAWPSLSSIVLFQNTFARYGFAMIELPPAGLYWVIFLTLIAAILIALHDSLSRDVPETRDHGLRSGMLAYSGVAGLGAMTYYVGRSHSSVLIAVFCAWLLVLVQLAWRAWPEWRRLVAAHAQPWRSRISLPAWGLLVLCLMLAHEAVHYPNPIAQAKRIAQSATARDDSEAGILALIGKYVPPGGRTCIVYPRAHWLALRAGVRNEFPFAHSLSLLLRQQVDVTLAALDKLPLDSRFVFGAVPAEMAEALRAAGYVTVDGRDDFVVWQRIMPPNAALDDSSAEESG